MSLKHTIELLVLAGLMALGVWMDSFATAVWLIRGLFP